MSPIPLPPPLSRELKLTELAPGEYAGELADSFCFGPRVFGGAVMTMIQKAAGMYHPKLRRQPDMLSMQLQFFRWIFSGEVLVTLHDVHVGRAASTIKVVVSQGKKDCVLGLINMGDLERQGGLSIDTGWSLEPAPTEATLPQVAADTDPRWVTFQRPYHPDSFSRVQSYLKFSVPYELQDRSIRDHWLRPSDPSEKFTNDSLGFLVDIALPLLDNYYPEDSLGHHAHAVAVGLRQRRLLAAGGWAAEDLDERSGVYDTPATYMSLAVTVEFKAKLPRQGVDWLFLRARVRYVDKGRMNVEAFILDEQKRLVAISQQLCQVIDISRVRTDKQKL